MSPYYRVGVSGVLILASTVLHELAHGFVALWLGDTTPRVRGRLTLNPRPHFDLFGWGLVPAVSWIWFQIPIAYARPAPVNPRRLSRGAFVAVCLSGPVVNALLAGVFSLGFRGVFEAGLWGWLPASTVPPVLDGLKYGIVMNLVVGTGNLLPFPPLDGSRVLTVILPSYMGRIWHQTSVLWVGLFVLAALWYTQPVREVVEWVVQPTFRLLTGASFLI